MVNYGESVGMTRALRTVIAFGPLPRWQREMSLKLLLGWTTMPTRRRR